MTIATTTSAPLLEVDDLCKSYAPKRGLIGSVLARGAAPSNTLKNVSFDLGKGEILGVVGESGSGKSTLGFTILGLVEASSGSVRFDGNPLPGSARELRAFRRSAQMIFQDPYQSLNPRFRIKDIVTEPLLVYGLIGKGDVAAAAEEVLELVGLRPGRNYLERFPHELSGGQRQRVSIARAVVLEPKLLIADEPVSMLDVSIRAGILRLLRSLSASMEMSVVYISHDLSTVRYICDRVAVMYRGEIVEIGSTDQIIANPAHPYTKRLLSAVPRISFAEKRQRVAQHA